MQNTTRNLLILAFFVAIAPAATAGSEKAEAKVNLAIDSLRGHDPRTHSAEESEALDQLLDDAWKVLLKHPTISRRLIPEVLANEEDDSLLLIDLSHLFLVLDESADAQSQAASWLLRANPQVYPSGYFKTAVIMGSERCMPCLPAVLNLLELPELNTLIVEHALPVDLDLGLIFTIGPFGDQAVKRLTESLSHKTCTVRRNAARILATLLPEERQTGLEAMALHDVCQEARESAWRALGGLGAPTLPSLVQQRLELSPEPQAAEKAAMIQGLGSFYLPFDHTSLEKLALDADPAVKGSARETLEALREEERRMAELLANVGTRAEQRSKVVKLLKRAEAKGHFEFQGTAKDIEAALSPDDLPLLNSARGSVLRRLSDECLYEWKKLTLAATLFRHMKAASRK